ncbi:MAG TPA: hypothetical protein VGR24_08605 [bacterium]|jgi:hypothetical protein|nr:hypothetical protein [bacterium]
MRADTIHALGPLIVAAIAINLVLAGWAFAAGLTRRRALGPAFWITLLLGLVLVVVEAGLGILLAAGGARPRTPLHFLYGVLVAIAAAAQFGLRPGGVLRRAMQRTAGRPFNEPQVLALLCLTQAALLMRAYMTGALGR